jgi:poly(A) polymerase
MVDAQAAGQIGLRWRLSNKELERVVWLVEHHAALGGARTKRHSTLQPLLVSEGIEDLLALHELAAAAGPDEAAFCRSLLAQPREVLDPPPLLSGDDLLAHGVPAGPQFRPLLQQVRDAQLDGQIHTRAEALALVARGQASRRREPPGG